jgi:hypothetical protein
MYHPMHVDVCASVCSVTLKHKQSLPEKLDGSVCHGLASVTVYSRMMFQTTGYT